jgi:histidyl-tRNA synthetase
MKADKQFKRALESGAKHTLRLERTDAGAIQAKLKNLTTRNEQTVPANEVIAALGRP